MSDEQHRTLTSASAYNSADDWLRALSARMRRVVESTARANGQTVDKLWRDMVALEGSCDLQGTTR
jgi:hypothetical protein